ncbi:hypothetical protein CEUSTIGMA_g4899.t1 [Chlamydomonas eustigma]|uniref:Uncharacterized protein n=1 Tax=Chlamydomonas eustigma TaxID=1157962 RepID=A0A250X317_9CHLO|nr:hypothetical protein CEUSTIGMA_g4899.t1 [Chlamydomonas eustigma]|eukprot:GAX77455.1 hypothetical protein CEUSTIGMA_g4899.t1 [Chlamydomonas eustigma]
MLPMNHLPVLDKHVKVPETPDWGRASGNIEDTKIVVGALKSLIDDAVFLDEDAYYGAAQLSSLQNKLQAANRRIQEMEMEATALRAEVDSKNENILELTSSHKEAKDQILELKLELENNAKIFQMHYQEIITRNEEIERLNAMVAAASGEASF